MNLSAILSFYIALLRDYIFIRGWLIAQAQHPDGGAAVYEYCGLMMNVANILQSAANSHPCKDVASSAHWSMRLTGLTGGPDTSQLQKSH